MPDVVRHSIWTNTSRSVDRLHDLRTEKKERNHVNGSVDIICKHKYNLYTDNDVLDVQVIIDAVFGTL